MTQPDEPTEQESLAELASQVSGTAIGAAAGSAFDLYQEYVSNGFSDSQAIFLTAVVCTDNPIQTPYH